MAYEYMAKINNYCQKRKLKPTHDISLIGPSHDPEITVTIKINDVEYGTGTGKNKKEAKAVAAKKTWEMIEKQLESPSNMQSEELMTTRATLLPVDYVSMLNTYSQKEKQIVDYPATCIGEAHARMYSCSCTISGVLYGRGTGLSRAAAKQAAAKQAFEKLHEEEPVTLRSEKPDSNSTFSESSHSSQVPAQSDSDNRSICFEDPAAKLVEKMKDVAVCDEKTSPFQRGARSPAQKFQRKLAANFDNSRNKEEKRKMADSDKNLPDFDTSISEENGSPYTVNDRFLAGFKNIESIGDGGFGNVFKATGKFDEKTYAVKRVQFAEKVAREVKELARLEHENIVRYYSCWKGDDHVIYPASRQKSHKKILCFFIQMELCEHGPLENWIEKNRQDRKYYYMAQNKFLQILRGVEYIHSKGLIHRDLKPQNIFVSHEDKIKIGDFGLVTSVECETLTKDRGTSSYMAPEQVGDKYGKEVDIYALGLIWFEMLWEFTFHEKSQLWPDVKAGQLPESFTNRFPAEAPIIKKMLSRQPSERYSASDILNFMSCHKDNSFRNHTR